jgi:hypothetical protein
VVEYHPNGTGKGQRCNCQLVDGSTKRVSTNQNADDRYPRISARLYETDAVKMMRIE